MGSRTATSASQSTRGQVGSAISIAAELLITVRSTMRWPPSTMRKRTRSQLRLLQARALDQGPGKERARERTRVAAIPGRVPGGAAGGATEREAKARLKERPGSLRKRSRGSLSSLALGVRTASSWIRISIPPGPLRKRSVPLDSAAVQIERRNGRPSVRFPFFEDLRE